MNDFDEFCGFEEALAVHIHRFWDHFWILFGSFLDDSWRLLRFISIGSGIVLGSFLDALWRLLRFISIDSGIVLGSFGHDS